KDVLEFKKNGFVKYEDFGAKGDGKTDDIDAIAATHAFANQYGLVVKANEKATYYIGGKQRTAIIQTNTHFGKASFIINDTDVQSRSTPVFMVSSGLQSFKLTGITSIKQNQQQIKGFAQKLSSSCIITVTNANIKRYIRYGLNQNNGASQTDIFLVDKEGNVDAKTPIIWDFDQITEMVAQPIDDKLLTISGGRFTTIANKAASKYTYYNRNILIKRSNVTVDGLQHFVIGEEEQGAPYSGFILVNDCSNVIVRNCLFTGHKTYQTIGSAGKPVSMGTYDITVNRALNVSFINCKQSNNINDKTYWGIFGSNYSKNLLYDSCYFSRFDAHMGVANATIRNSILGHMGINAIGSGTLLVENTTVSAATFINLRSDYGSTWQGKFIIRNCIFTPAKTSSTNVSLIGGAYSGQHDFGYTCYMPEHIAIENLVINDANFSISYKGPTIFANFNPQMNDDAYQQKFPYIITKEIHLKNVAAASGKKLSVSENNYLFKDVQIIWH
ncbi:MAG: hypothetical protein ACOVNY_02275, partial [Chitinophagaceae bacterium]